MDTSSSTHQELFQYLRKLVDTGGYSTDPYPQFALVEAYWHLGRIIVETEQDGLIRADYGVHLIEGLSLRLTQAFGKGYSLPNMWRFKQFFLTFPILSTNGRELGNLRKHFRAELCWSHYRLLMKIKNLPERTFYLNQAADQRWTVRFTQKLIRGRYYQQVALGDTSLLKSPKKVASSLPSTIQIENSGNSLRTRVALIKKGLLERYVGYAFVSQRHYISVAGQGRWIDLVFFHINLQRFVLIQLGEFQPTQEAACALLVDAYQHKQSPTIINPPIGLLINQAGEVKNITVSFESGLSFEEQVQLPISFH